jgi:hypothetical protein
MARVRIEVRVGFEVIAFLPRERFEWLTDVVA